MWVTKAKVAAVKFTKWFSLFLGISFKFIDKLLDLYCGHEIPNSLKEPSIYVRYRYYPPFSFSADKRWGALGLKVHALTVFVRLRKNFDNVLRLWRYSCVFCCSYVLAPDNQ